MASIVGTISNAVRLEENVLKVSDSRVSLDSIVYAFNDGMNATEIQYNYDSLTLAEVYAAIAYYLHDKAVVDAYIAKRRVEREDWWRDHEAKFPPKITREILLARRNGRE